MKTLSLTELVRRPSAVKKATAKGQTVRITDKGKPLWVLMPDVPPQAAVPDDFKSDAERDAWLDGYLDELLAETPRKGKSLARMVLEDRGK